MRNYLLAAVAAAALTTPAMARDDSVYVGVDAGVMLVEDTSLDFNYDYDLSYDVDDGIVIDHDIGFDVDLVAGYDFGLVRGEIELGYKRANIDEVQLDVALVDFLGGVPDPSPTEPFEADGNVRVMSAMANVLFDFGDEDGWSGFLGAGAGYADVKYKLDIPGVDVDPDPDDEEFGFSESESDGSVAWQILAGIRKAITPNIDLGLKYRFFNVSKLKFEGDDEVINLDGRFRSHSLMLSLLYNFAAPAPPPPPPPPPPAPERG